MYNERYITYELALRLREIGFPQHKTPTSYSIVKDGGRGLVVGDFVNHGSGESDEHLIDAPTQDALCRWLRETQNIDILVDVVEHWFTSEDECYYRYRVYKDRRYIEDDDDYLFETYDDAIEMALNKIFRKYKGYKLDLGYGRTATNDD